MQMTIDRAIEILDPEHREHYESIDPVNTACRMGTEALEYRKQKKVTMKGNDMPEKITDGIGFPRIDTDICIDGKWVRWSSHVTHWMLLPNTAHQIPKGAENERDFV